MPSASPKVPLPTSTLSTNTTLPSDVHAQLTSALLSSAAIPRIQTALAHELSASGWTDNLRAHVQQLLRSGECASYGDVMARVMKDVSSSKDLEGMTMSNGVNGVDGTNLTNGVSKGIGEKSVEEGGIKVPDTVVKEGIRVVKKEMEKVAEVVVDDE